MQLQQQAPRGVQEDGFYTKEGHITLRAIDGRGLCLQALEVGSDEEYFRAVAHLTRLLAAVDPRPVTPLFFPSVSRVALQAS